MGAIPGVTLGPCTLLSGDEEEDQHGPEAVREQYGHLLPLLLTGLDFSIAVCCVEQIV